MDACICRTIEDAIYTTDFKPALFEIRNSTHRCLSPYKQRRFNACHNEFQLLRARPQLRRSLPITLFATSPRFRAINR